MLFSLIFENFARKEKEPTYNEARSVIEFNTPVPQGSSICPSTGLPCDCGNNNNNNINNNNNDHGILFYILFKSIKIMKILTNKLKERKLAPNCLEPTNLTSDIIFPPFLKKYDPLPLKIAGEKITWYQPTSLEQLLNIKVCFIIQKTLKKFILIFSSILLMRNMNRKSTITPKLLWEIPKLELK